MIKIIEIKKVRKMSPLEKVFLSFEAALCIFLTKDAYLAIINFINEIINSGIKFSTTVVIEIVLIKMFHSLRKGCETPDFNLIEEEQKRIRKLDRN